MIIKYCRDLGLFVLTKDADTDFNCHCALIRHICSGGDAFRCVYLCKVEI